MAVELFFPPGPQKSLILGNAPELQRNPLQFMQESARAYGEFVHFRFGPSHAYLLTNPSHAHYVLAEQPELFTDRINLFRSLNSAFGHDLFAPKERIQPRPRQRPLFQPRWLDTWAPQMASLAAEMVATWPADGTRDIVADLQQLTLHVAARVLLDTPATDLADRVCRAMAAMPELSDRSFHTPLTLPTRATRQQAELAETIRQILREQQSTGGEQSGLLAQMADAAAGRGGGKALDVQVREEAVELFLAGHETTAHTLAWALHLLAQTPDVLTALTEEVDHVLGDGAPTLADADALVLTEMVVRETLRLYPPAWLISRQAKSETRIGNYFLPSGSTVYISPYIMQRSARYFATPEAFIPERFAAGYDRRLPRYAYMPFGAGPRALLAQPVVLLQTRLLLAAIVRQFALSPVDSAPVAVEPGLTLRPRGSLPMRWQARTAASVNTP